MAARCSRWEMHMQSNVFATSPRYRERDCWLSAQQPQQHLPLTLDDRCVVSSGNQCTTYQRRLGRPIAVVQSSQNLIRCPATHSDTDRRWLYAENGHLFTAHAVAMQHLVQNVGGTFLRLQSVIALCIWKPTLIITAFHSVFRVWLAVFIFGDNVYSHLDLGYTCSISIFVVQITCRYICV